MWLVSYFHINIIINNFLNYFFFVLNLKVHMFSFQSFMMQVVSFKLKWICTSQLVFGLEAC